MSIASRKAEIQKLLDTNDRAVCRAIIVIYNRQTEAEKCSATTQEDNGIGFSGVDATILSSFAEQLLGINRRAVPMLSARQLEIARPKIRRYWKQLLDAADQKAKKIA